MEGFVHIRAILIKHNMFLHLTLCAVEQFGDCHLSKRDRI